MKRLPAYEALEASWARGDASCPVYEETEREFVMDGVRYFCGRSAERHAAGGMGGWIVYKSEPVKA